MLTQRDIYQTAMRLIERHGEAAEMAAVLRADPLMQRGADVRQAIIDAIAYLRSLGSGARPN
jgi:hypothetical protein